MRRQAQFSMIGGGIAGIAAIALLLVMWGSWKPAPASPSSGDAAAPPRGVAVAALGRIEPQSETIHLGGAPTDVIADLAVVRGSTVVRGQVIGHFRGYDEAVAREKATTAQLAEARAQLAAQQALGEARIRAAQEQLDSIVAVDPMRIESQAAAVHSIEIEIANNVDILDGRKQLHRDEFASRRDLDDQRALVERQRSDLVGARSRLDELRRTFEFDRANAEAALAVERANTALAQAQIPVASLEQQLALAHAEVETASLVAPIDGTVLNVFLHPGEAVGSSPILALGDTSKMRVVAEVYETDVPRVRLGQRARITSPALERPLEGTVVEIGRMIFKNDVLDVDPAARTDARIVEVRIALDDGAAVAGLTNLTVDTVISTDTGVVQAQSATSAR